MSKAKVQFKDASCTTAKTGIPFPVDEHGMPLSDNGTPEKSIYAKAGTDDERPSHNAVCQLLFRKSPEDARMFHNLLELMRGYAWAYKRSKEADHLPRVASESEARVECYSNKALNAGTVKIILPVVVDLIEHEYFSQSDEPQGYGEFGYVNPGRGALEAIADLVTEVDTTALRFGTWTLSSRDLAEALKAWAKRRH